MNRNFKKTGIVRNIRFLIKDENTVRIWKPENIELYDFRLPCNLILKYLVDEGFMKIKDFKVEVVT